MRGNDVRLEWEGKRKPEIVAPAPGLICLQRHGETAEGEWQDRLIWGDNLAVMSALREELIERFALIYFDPPFFTGKEWQARRNRKQESDQTDSRSKTEALEAQESACIAFSDDWNHDLGTYLQWLYDRLALAKDLLSAEGSLYLHLSWHSAHYAKLILDEIFGVERFQNEIIWCYREGINSKKRWNRKHDTLLFYSKSDRFTFNPAELREPYSDSHVKKYKMRDEKGAYRLMGRGIVGSPLQSHRDLPPEYEIQYPELTYRHYLGQGTLPVDYWHIDIENQASQKRTGYPTQKPEALLERIVLASSNQGDLIGDFCCGSGTTVAVAQRLNRRWIGCDAGELAISTTSKRLQALSSKGFRLEQAVPAF